MGPNALSDALEARLTDLVHDAGIVANQDLVLRILRTALLFGREDSDRLDLKMASAALSEMREAFALFRPFRETPKVTVFGSARTKTDDVLYQQALAIAQTLAAEGWMVVTGAGPGIMQAAAVGAGPEKALGVSIRLPFEERSAVPESHNGQTVNMKYFFTRKLALVKESQGFVCLPGGFGTMDEMFELLTLQQTGKAEPVPIVLLDAPGGTFWQGLRTFVDENLVPAGLVETNDLDRVLITDSVSVAAMEITKFWQNYDSLRWVGDQLVLRLRHLPTDQQVQQLSDEFAGICAEGGISVTSPLPAEVADNDRLDLPRLLLTPLQRGVGSLHLLIKQINNLDTA